MLATLTPRISIVSVDLLSVAGSQPARRAEEPSVEIVKVLVDTFLAAQLGDRLLATQAFKDDADLLFR